MQAHHKVIQVSSPVEESPLAFWAPRKHKEGHIGSSHSPPATSSGPFILDDTDSDSGHHSNYSHSPAFKEKVTRKGKEPIRANRSSEDRLSALPSFTESRVTTLPSPRSRRNSENDQIDLDRQLALESNQASARLVRQLFESGSDKDELSPNGGQRASEHSWPTKRSAVEPTIEQVPMTKARKNSAVASVSNGEGRSTNVRSSSSSTAEPPQSRPKTKRIETPDDGGPDLSDPSEPKWYKNTAVPNTRGKGLSYPSTVDGTFGSIKPAAMRCEDAAKQGLPLPSEELGKILNAIHAAFFVPFKDEKTARAAIRKNRMLHEDGGLLRLFYSRHQTQLPSYPYYLIADAKELYTKWWQGTFETSLYRGISVGKVANAKLNRESQANRLEPNWPGRRTGKFHGNGALLNGQWWPHQLCAVRDGAHNSAMAGIAGGVGEGAWSVIVAGDPKYPDIDEGEELWYCGTEGNSAAEPTAATQRMLESAANGLEVRVIRSEKCKNPLYRPEKGYRYDGLYTVVGGELLDKMKSHYRFHLRRVPGQDPIRYEGPGKRPTRKELEAFDHAKAERKYLV